MFTQIEATVERLSSPELETRAAAAHTRVEERVSRAKTEGRDLTDREAGLCESDRRELAALRAEIEHRERQEEDYADKMSMIDDAVRGTPRPETRGAIAAFTRGLANGVPTRVVVEARAVTSANAGARGAVAAGAIGRPQWLWQAAQIPFFPADSLKVSGPKFAALVARSATAEGANKPNLADPTLEEETLEAFAVVEEISDQVVRFGVGAQAVSERLASESVFSVNAAFADALEAAAGTPVAYAGSANRMADLGIARIWARTGAKPTALLVNSADYPALSDKAAVGPGDGIGTEVVLFNGTPLLVNDSITAGIGVVFNGRGFTAHGTDVLLASAPNLGNNTVTLRAETYAALLQHDAGAIVAVDLTA